MLGHVSEVVEEEGSGEETMAFSDWISIHRQWSQIERGHFEHER
jgi:hypothetical protein